MLDSFINPAEHRTLGNENIYLADGAGEKFPQTFAQVPMASKIASMQDAFTFSFNQKHVSVKSGMTYKIGCNEQFPLIAYIYPFFLLIGQHTFSSGQSSHGILISLAFNAIEVFGRLYKCTMLADHHLLSTFSNQHRDAFRDKVNQPGMVSVVMREKDGIRASGYLLHLSFGEFFFVCSRQIGAEVNDDLDSISFNYCDAAAYLMGTMKGDFHSLIKVSWYITIGSSSPVGIFSLDISSSSSFLS